MRASESRIVEPNPFFRSQLLMKVAGFGVSLLIILTVGYLRWNGFQQQLVITVDANRSVQADIYVDSGLGMVSVPSLLGTWRSQYV